MFSSGVFLMAVECDHILMVGYGLGSPRYLVVEQWAQVHNALSLLQVFSAPWSLSTMLFLNHDSQPLLTIVWEHCSVVEVFLNVHVAECFAVVDQGLQGEWSRRRGCGQASAGVHQEERGKSCTEGALSSKLCLQLEVYSGQTSGKSFVSLDIHSTFDSIL